MGNSRLGGGLELLSCLAIPLGATAKKFVTKTITATRSRGFDAKGRPKINVMHMHFSLNAAPCLTTPDPEAIERCAGSIWPVKERPVPRVETLTRDGVCPDSTSRVSGYLFPP